MNAIGRAGARPGNTSLIRTLGWPEDLYWAIRNRLIDRGLLEKGKGKGGSVRLVTEEQPITTVNPATGQPVELPREPENTLYEPMLAVIRDAWVKEQGYRESITEITAKSGRMDTGGKWTRPDITVAGIRIFPFVPGKHFDIVTFEIKQADSLDVTVVYEALSHRRSAMKSYVLLHVPDEVKTLVEKSLGIIFDEAKRHGIGLIVAADPNNYSTWDPWLDAERYEPDPENLNTFIARQLSQGSQQEIIAWFR
ncbi:hypothetical protein D3C72_132410 [compost metagenome]